MHRTNHSSLLPSRRVRVSLATGRLLGRTLLGAAALVCAVTALPSAASTAKVPAGEKVARGSNCLSCHALHHKVVGPAFEAVAKRYGHKSGAKAMLIHAVKYGHVGTWGKIPMPPHPNLSAKQLDEVVTWVLSIKPQAAAAASSKTYTYTVKGKKVTLDFPVYKPGTHKVTKSVFRGYELFNSYCFRCHGEDAVGSEYAPDLRVAIKNGMTEQQMTQIAMEGRKAKGMPSWAGFFSPADLKAIYEYTAGRAYHLVGEGIPPQ